jgi:hypothetical protein
VRKDDDEDGKIEIIVPVNKIAVNNNEMVFVALVLLLGRFNI